MSATALQFMRVRCYLEQFDDYPYFQDANRQYWCDRLREDAAFIIGWGA